MIWLFYVWCVIGYPICTSLARPDLTKPVDARLNKEQRR